MKWNSLHITLLSIFVAAGASAGYYFLVYRKKENKNTAVFKENLSKVETSIPESEYEYSKDVSKKPVVLQGTPVTYDHFPEFDDDWRSDAWTKIVNEFNRLIYKYSAHEFPGDRQSQLNKTAYMIIKNDVISLQSALQTPEKLLERLEEKGLMKYLVTYNKDGSRMN